MAAIPAQFALAPGLVNDEIIDYSTNEGAKLFAKATAKLSAESLYACQPENLKVFLTLVQARAQVSGWGDILDIPMDAEFDPNIDLASLIDRYGERNLEQIRSHVALYINTHTRAAQDSAQLYHCLINSLSEQGIAKVMINKPDFTVMGSPSGVAMLKVIIRESHIDTNATTRHIREKLSELDKYLATVEYDMVKLNDHAKDLMNSLRARGEMSTDLVSNLFRAYKSAPDKNFRRYIAAKEDDYDEGYNITPEQLMQRVSNKYRTLVEDKIWNAPSQDEKKILALQARIDRMTTSDSRNRQDRTGEGGGPPKTKVIRPEWMMKVPEEGKETLPITNNGKEYWWCVPRKCWCRHKPEDCNSKIPTKAGESGGTKKESTDSRKEKLLRAYQAMLDAQDSQSEEDNDE